MRRRTKGRSKSAERGFTLLEVMVATVIMSVAVTALLTNLQSSLRLGTRATEYKRAVLFAQQKMDELIAEPALSSYRSMSGSFAPSGTWRAAASPFDCPPHAQTGAKVLQRIELQVEWSDSGRTHHYSLDGFRQSVLSEADALRISK